MPLGEYHRKRDFSKTPEPRGDDDAAKALRRAAGAAGATGATAAGITKGGRYVVQRHRATRLHYDFRLEVDGVLVSWAVPRGPSLDPSQRRMAIHVEDHPLEYFDFEGVIPKGEYGGGDVIVWDWGTWSPEAETPDPGRAIDDGELKFRLDGEKLHGRYTIVKTGGRGRAAAARRAAQGDDDGDDQWLLIKKRDDAAVDGWDAEDQPKSVKTGRTNDEVKAARDAYWISQAPAAVAEIDLSAAKPAPPPTFIPPMLATLADKAFDDPDWLFEVKWDGYRTQAVLRDGQTRIYTRKGLDAGTYFPRLLPLPGAWISAESAVLDGEVVALDEDGRPDFGLLQLRISEATGGKVPGVRGKVDPPEPEPDGRRAPLVYEVFDLLYLDGRSLLDVPLVDRKRLLRSVLKDHGSVRFAAHIEGDGAAFYRAAEAQRLEGIVAKHRRSRYEPGRRSTTWLKIKARPEQELVVGGWTPGEGNAKDLGAVIVGVYEQGELRFAGKVGSGFDSRTRTTLRRRLDALATDACPFDPVPSPRPELRQARWVRPELVIRAELGGWTRDGLVRQTSFKGIDEGKDPATVIREVAVSTREAEAEAHETVAAEDADEAKATGGTKGRGRHARPAEDGDATEAAEEPGAATRRRTGPKRANESTPAAWAAADPSELSALERMGNAGLWSVGGQELKLTNLDKVLFPPPDGTDEPPITKRELVRYFARIAPAMLPHLAERPLNLHRYPDGAGHQGFWQKDLKPTDPTWLRRWREVGVEGRQANEHVIADRTATLCWLGNLAAFEVHAWTSRLPDAARPTFALIDIDPGTATTWDETLTLARLYRTALGHLGVRGYPKLTGRRGIQVWIPVEPRYTFEETSAWVEGVSRAVGGIVPALVSWEWSVAERGGRARLDYTQNTYIKTLVAPYAVRPAAGAPVSAPITWDELDDPDLRPNRWGIRTIVERVDQLGDLFAPAQTDLQVLPELG
ncbi:MAG TPA: DNA ligase D [Candidatus Dormibacteraeota bacterium]|nr:DNA ligase D [Candidatus Dormibacteraeota bacterium]